MMRLTSVVRVILTLALGMAGCKKAGGAGGGANAKEILIGEYGSLTGGTATFGQSTHEGLLLAIEQVNAAGGALGKPIKVITADDRSDASEAVTAVQKLINSDGVVAVIGEVASKRSLAGAGICTRYKIPMLSPSSTNPDVTVENGHVRPWIFRICFTDTFQGRANGRFAADQNWKRIAVLTNSDEDYSKGLSKFFKQDYQGHGQIVADETYRNSDRDFKSQLTNIKNQNPDAVYVPGYYTEVKLILPQAKEIGLNVPFFGGDGWDSPETLALPEAQGDFYSDHYTPQDPSPRVQEFVTAYRAKYGKTPDAMAVLGYDAGKVVAAAIQRAGKAEPDAIRAALEQTKDFPGASGTITIDKDHNARKPLVEVQVRDQKPELFKVYSPEQLGD
jgi:branched-chain amino acid transport system substrate-binding protein